MQTAATERICSGESTGQTLQMWRRPSKHGWHSSTTATAQQRCLSTARSIMHLASGNFTARGLERAHRRQTAHTARAGSCTSAMTSCSMLRCLQRRRAAHRAACRALLSVQRGSMQLDAQQASLQRTARSMSTISCGLTSPPPSRNTGTAARSGFWTNARGILLTPTEALSSPSCRAVQSLRDATTMAVQARIGERCAH